jgi:uncharacterized protein (UPF0262 family)
VGGSSDDDAEGATPDRIAAIELDERTVARRNPEVEHERRVAIYDLLENNLFRPLKAPGTGPYRVVLSIEDNSRLIVDVGTEDGTAVDRIALPLLQFKKIVKDYFRICEAYFDAIKHAAPSKIEAIDMGRRGLHDEGSDMLRDRLRDAVEMDHDTARRLFTLICVLHAR